MHPETADEGTDIRQFVRNRPPTSSTTSGDPEQNGNGLSSVSTQAGLDFLKEQLQGMFPNVSTSTIAQAISNSQNLPEAIDHMLSANRSNIEGIYNRFTLGHAKQEETFGRKTCS